MRAHVSQLLSLNRARLSASRRSPLFPRTLRTGARRRSSATRSILAERSPSRVPAPNEDTRNPDDAGTDCARGHGRQHSPARPPRPAERPARTPGDRPARRTAERAVEGRRHRAAQREREVEAGGRRPVRARAHRDGLRTRGLRLHPRRRPPRTLPLVGPVHAAQARDRRRPDRDARAARARDRYFMLRVRIDGGALTTEQLRVVAGISTEFARDSADITDRQNIQLHWVEVEDVPEIWRRLESVGLQTTEACGDVPRVVLGSPVAGIAADELIDIGPAVAGITEKYIGVPSSRTCPASSRRRSPATRARTSSTRSTTSPSSRTATRSSASGSTSGSAAGCPRTRASGAPRGVRHRGAGARRGTASCRSSATTATAGCATRRA